MLRLDGCAQLTELWQEVNRTAMQMLMCSFRWHDLASPNQNYRQNSGQRHTRCLANQLWTREDRSGIYGGVFAYYLADHKAD